VRGGRSERGKNVTGDSGKRQVKGEASGCVRRIERIALGVAKGKRRRREKKEHAGGTANRGFYTTKKGEGGVKERQSLNNRGVVYWQRREGNTFGYPRKRTVKRMPAGAEKGFSLGL